MFSDSAELEAARKKVDELARIALVDELTGAVCANANVSEMDLTAIVAESVQWAREH